MSRVKLSSAARLIVEDAGAILYSGFGVFAIEGKGIADFAKALLPFLDGNRSRDEIFAAFPDEEVPNVKVLMEILDRRGVIETTDNELLPTPLRSQQRFFQAFTDNPEKLTQKLQESSVLIVGLETGGVVAASQLAAVGVGSLHLADDGVLSASDALTVEELPRHFAGSLRRDAVAARLSNVAASCRVTTSASCDAEDLVAQGRRWDLLVATMSPEDLAGQLRWAKVAHNAGLVSFFNSSNAFESVIGPLVIPRETACWNCARLRMLANAEHSWAAHKVQNELLVAHEITSLPAKLLPSSSMTGSVLALEALKFLSGYAASKLAGALFVQNLISLETSFHKVIPMPWCEVCGGAGATEPSAKEVVWPQDDHDPGEFFAGWLDARTGIVSGITKRELRTFTSSSLHCVHAVTANYTEGVAPSNTAESCGGKGLTHFAATVGAMGEAIERYSASRFRLTDMLRSPLGGEDFLDPRKLCLYEERQYEDKAFPFVRFDPDQPHLWTRGRWLDSGEDVWVPALMTFYNFPDGVEQPFCQTTTNGLAAGSSLDDAALRAVLELIERDAFLVSWLARRPGKRVLIDDSLDPAVRSVVSQLEDCKTHLELYLVDAGLKIPVIVCLGLGDGESWPGLTVSSAAHLSPQVAMRNAILEQAYSGIYLRHLMLEGRSAPATPAQVSSESFLDHGLYYLPRERAGAADFLRVDKDAVCLRSLEEPADVTLAECSRRLTAAGIRVAVADVTSPDVALGPFRVVRALGINMQPIHCGYGLERTANPRLKSFLNGPLNASIHPLC